MATITKTKLWKKMTDQADKIKFEVKRINKTDTNKTPAPKKPEVGEAVYDFASESPHHASKLHNFHASYEEEDEGIYEDFSSSNPSEYSFAGEKSASAEDLRHKDEARYQQSGNRLGIPCSPLHQKFKDFHIKTTSLPRNVKGSNNLGLPTHRHMARSMENLSYPRKEALTPKHHKTAVNQYRRENTYPPGQESETVDNVLYKSMDTAQGETYAIQKRNPLYSSSSSVSGSDERNVHYNFAADPQTTINTQSRHNHIKVGAKSTTRPTKYAPEQTHMSGTWRDPSTGHADEFEDEPVFGTIEVRYANTYEPLYAHYGDMDDDSVYHEAGNFYDFE